VDTGVGAATLVGAGVVLGAALEATVNDPLTGSARIGTGLMLIPVGVGILVGGGLGLAMNNQAHQRARLFE
jgi:hypothetical protein